MGYDYKYRKPQYVEDYAALYPDRVMKSTSHGKPMLRIRRGHYRHAEAYINQRVWDDRIKNGGKKRRKFLPGETKPTAAERMKAWTKANPERHKRNCHAWQERNPERNREFKRQWIQRNLKKMRDLRKQWKIKNPDRVKAQRNARRKERVKTDLQLAMLERLRARLVTLVRRSKVEKCSDTVSLLGCSLADFRTYIESKFTQGMSWELVGPKIHIDHIRPCASFDLTNHEEQRACFHYTNLQPLWRLDNMRKGAHWGERSYRKPPAKNYPDVETTTLPPWIMAEREKAAMASPS